MEKTDKQEATVRQVLQKLHATIVSKDYDGMRALFHPDFERYAFGRFSPELIEGTTDSAGAIKFLHEHGSFLKLAFTEPIGDKTEAVFRIEYTYAPSGLDVSFSHVHLVHVRISSSGLITFWDAFFDSEAQNRMLDLLDAKAGGHSAPPASSPPHLAAQ